MNILLLQEDEIEIFKPVIPAELYADMTQLYYGAIEDDGTPAGVIAWRMNECVIDISYVYVTPAYRRQGVAKLLINHIVELSRQFDLHKYVFVTYSKSDADGAIDAILRGMDDFVVKREGCLVEIEPEQLKENTYCNKLKAMNGEVFSFFDMDEAKRSSFYKYLEDNDLEMFGEDEEENLLQDISVCTLDSSGKEIDTCMLFKMQDEDTLELAFMMVKPQHEKKLAPMMGEAFRRYESEYDGKRLLINSVNHASEKLIDKVFTDCEKEDVFTAVCIG